MVVHCWQNSDPEKFRFWVITFSKFIRWFHMRWSKDLIRFLVEEPRNPLGAWTSANFFTGVGEILQGGVKNILFAQKTYYFWPARGVRAPSCSPPPEAHFKKPKCWYPLVIIQFNKLVYSKTPFQMSRVTSETMPSTMPEWIVTSRLRDFWRTKFRNLWLLSIQLQHSLHFIQ